MPFRLPTNDEELRQDAAEYTENLRLKALELNHLPRLIRTVKEYLQKYSIEDVVLGVSGGLDSAVALAVLVEVQKEIELTIHAEVIYFNTFNHVFDSTYIEKLEEVYHDRVIFNEYDLTEAFDSMISVMWIPGGVNKQVEANVTYALRYQALFARAQHEGGITIGTTNADELEFAGWFGKNSDMVTDVQFLWRFPKCVVRLFAEQLGVPREIIDRVPVGDLIDGSSDEQNFGVTYDELRWYTVWRGPYLERPGPHRDYIKQKFQKLEDLHARNAHKYAFKQITHYNPVFL